jgi:hypothetical protein
VAVNGAGSVICNIRLTPMAIVRLTEQQKAAIRDRLTAEQASHLIYDACDDTFYFGSVDDIAGWIRDVLCVETFFGAMCDGGVTTWFDWCHARLAPFVPRALRAVGLPDVAVHADRAMAIHVQQPYPATVAEWDPVLERIRKSQIDEDFSAEYDAIEMDFFALYHTDRSDFRTKLHAYILKHLDD